MTLTSNFPIVLMSLAVAFCLTPLAVWLARRGGLMDVPGASWHKQHPEVTPMAGGIVLALALVVCAIWQDWWTERTLLGILLGGAVILAFGLWDDASGLGVPAKMLGQIGAALILIATGTQVRMLPTEWVNIVLTLVWVVGIVNAFNFVDSMDGLALGLGGIASAFFLLVTVEANQPELAALSAALFGACVGSFFYNVIPAKMFLGDSGAQLIGFLLAAIGIAYAPAGLQIVQSWFVPILVLGIPIFDTVLVVFSRVHRRRPVYHAALDHTYHRLVRLGLEPTRAVVAMHVGGVVLGLGSFIALGAGALLGNLLFAAVVASGVVLVLLLERKQGNDLG